MASCGFTHGLRLSSVSFRRCVSLVRSPALRQIRTRTHRRGGTGKAAKGVHKTPASNFNAERLPGVGALLRIESKRIVFAGLAGVGALGCAAWCDRESVGWQPGEYFRSIESMRLRVNRELLNRFDHGPLRDDFLKRAQLTWGALPEHFRLLGAITAFQVTVLALWKVRPAQEMMWRYFMSVPFSGRYVQILGHQFSHQALLHIGFNTMALWSFTPLVMSTLGYNQFLGFSLCAGMASFSASTLHSCLIRSGRPGLGISGILMGIIGFYAAKNPERQLSLIFMPFYPIDAWKLFGGIMLLDVAGLVLGWSAFGHAAHLGGALFGIGYAFFGLGAYNNVRSRLATINVV